MKNNEPVLLNGTAASLAAAATPVLIYAGVQSDAAGRYGSLVGAGFAFVLFVWHLFSARSKVTPVAKGSIGTTYVDVVPRVVAPEPPTVILDTNTPDTSDPGGTPGPAAPADTNAV